MKNWKNLFVKNEEEENTASNKTEGQFSFPVNNTTGTTPVMPASATQQVNNSALSEVLEVYQKGIESINMPGYDFYEFYKAVGSISNAGDQVYNMAFQMAKSMDNGISPQKLVKDAEFYISKINDVHQQYSNQGQHKLNGIDNEKSDAKKNLSKEIELASQQINQMKIQLQKLESDINQKQLELGTIDGKYSPQETSIREKLLANDNAKHISISNLTLVKDGIVKYIKL